MPKSARGGAMKRVLMAAASLLTAVCIGCAPVPESVPSPVPAPDETLPVIVDTTPEPEREMPGIGVYELSDSIKSEDGLIMAEYDVTLPLIEPGGDISSEAADRINRYYAGEAELFIQYVRDEVFPMAENNYEYVAAEGGEFIPFYAVQSFETAYNDNGILSFSRELYGYFAGMADDIGVIADTFLIEDGSHLSLDDILEGDYKTALLDEISAQIDREGGVSAGYYEDYRNLAGEYFHSTQFYINERGIVICYPSITIAPRMMGGRRFEIPLAALGGYMQKEIF